MRPGVVSGLMVACGVVTAFAHFPVSSELLGQARSEGALSERNVHVYRGSLKDNLQRLARQYGWQKVVWQPDRDFQWQEPLALKHRNIYAAMREVIKNYPLRVVFYRRCRVLVVTERSARAV